MSFKSSLYRKFLAGFILIAALPLLGSSLYFYGVLQSYLYRDVARSSMAEARVAGRQVAWHIGEVRDAVKFTASQYLFTRKNGRLLSWVYRQHHEICKIVVVNTKNRVVESVARYGYLSPGSLSPLSAYTTEFPRKEMVFFSQWRLEPQLVLVYPIFSLKTGKQQGYLYAEINLKTLFNNFPRRATGAHQLSLINMQGEIVAHNEIEYVLQGVRVDHYVPVAKVLKGAESAYAEYRNVAQQAVLGVAVKVKGLPLLVISEMPIAKAYVLAHTLRKTFIYVFSLSLGLILLGSWYLSRSMTRPIASLFQASERIRQGSLEPVTGDFPDDEIGAFAHCFDLMVASLREDRKLREAAEERLRESEQRYRMVADYAYDMECWRNEKGEFIYLSPSCEKVTGYSQQDFYDNYLLMNDIVVAEDREIFVDHRHEVEQDGTFRPIEFRIHHKDGSIRWLNHICRPVTGPDGEAMGARGSNRDITARKLAEEFLQMEQERLAVTLRSIGDGVITTDTDGLITLINPVAENLTGWKSADALGKNISDVFRIINENSRKTMRCPVAQALQENRIIELMSHVLLISHSGEEIIIADSAAPILTQAGQCLGVVLVFRDVRTERKMQQERIRSEKLTAVGLLAGGIAHDFNNLLMGMQGSLDLIKISCGENREKTEAYLARADRAIERAVALAQQLLTFAKGGAPIKDRAKLPALVKESAEFVLHGSQIKVEYEIEEDIWGVEIDSGQISQVVNNLITNARQAMLDAGIIRVTIKNILAAVDEYPNLKPGYYVKVSVQDDGGGIDPAILPRIFEPYFTSKETGSGLGLATSYSIIANHEGRIEVDSQPGIGATFSFFLPATGKCEKEPVHNLEMPRKSLENAVQSESSRILLMDDEEVIRDVVSEMLEMLGYEVVAVEDGVAMLEAYKAAQQAGQKFHAVLMDISIPGGMGGREAIKHLRNLDAEVFAIVSSGYSQDPVMANFEAYGFNAMVSKPYKVDSLVAVLGDRLSKECGYKL